MLAVKDNRQWGNILSADKKLTMCSITKQVLDGIRSILPAELAQFLQSERPAVEQLSSGEVMLLDCRSFMAYNLQHIAGALNVNCTGIVKKRLQQGKLSLGDVVTPETGKDLIKSGKWHRAVVYDDSTSELDKIPASHTIRLVLGAVLSQGKEALLLKGNDVFKCSGLPKWVFGLDLGGISQSSFSTFSDTLAIEQVQNGSNSVPRNISA